MGVLDSCNDVLFPMICDVFYASETQDKYGAIEKKWALDSSRNCNLYSVTDNNQANKFGFDDKKFFNLETDIYGRVISDIRQSSDGRFFPLSHILIANVRIVGCESDELVFFETNSLYEKRATVFEPKTVNPYMGPMGSIEFFQVKMDRSDTQELNDLVAC